MANTLSSLAIFLALSHAFVVLAMATTPNHETAPSPSPMNPKLGLHQLEAASVASSHGSGSAPLLAPKGLTEKEAPAEQEEDLELKRHHHRSTMDKSVAGGGVILGGLATVFMVAVFCYVRATRRSKRDPESVSPV